MAHWRGGQVTVLFILPSGKSLSRAGLGGFCPSCHVAAHPKVHFPVSGQFSLWKCQAAVGGRSEEPEPCSLPDKSRGGGWCWCPLSSCALTAALLPCLRAGLGSLICWLNGENLPSCHGECTDTLNSCLCSIPEVCINTRWMCRHIVSWGVSVTAAGLESTCHS